ncbi:MAG: hypothetical protein IKX54_04790 [Lachnospiraceae bacterium]|nr:hypothetical protein [Lachnospiraceae bacterium]
MEAVYESDERAHLTPYTESEIKFRAVLLTAAEIFTAVTMLWLIGRGDYGHFGICIETFALVLSPLTVEKVFRCKGSSAMFALVLFYALGPIFGHCYKLHYLTSWWDKMHHFIGGGIFVFFGLFLFRRMAQARSIAGAALFAFCFSIMISSVWEIAEYGGDVLFGWDTQNDTYVSEINSYLLGDEPGEKVTISTVVEVEINGRKLPESGYLDIGLNDTMLDLIAGAAGALVAALFLMIDRGRHAAIYSRKREETGPA